MKSVTNTSVASGCICSQSHLLGHRNFLKSILPGAIAFCVLQSALTQKTLGNQYDWTALAGAFALAEFLHPADAIAF